MEYTLRNITKAILGIGSYLEENKDEVTEKLEELMEDLVEKGEEVEEDVQDFVEDLRNRFSGEGKTVNTDELESTIKDKVSGFLEKMGIAKEEDIEKLTEKLDSLLEKIKKK